VNFLTLDADFLALDADFLSFRCRFLSLDADDFSCLSGSLTLVSYFRSQITTLNGFSAFVTDSFLPFGISLKMIFLPFGVSFR
jgi:hypothetical protein